MINRKWYSGVFSMAPPERSGLDVDCTGVDLINEFFGSVGESGWGIGGTNEPQFSIGVGVLQNSQGIFKWFRSVRNSVPDIAVQVGLSYPSVNYGSHY